MTHTLSSATAKKPGTKKTHESYTSRPYLKAPKKRLKQPRRQHLPRHRESVAPAYRKRCDALESKSGLHEGKPAADNLWCPAKAKKAGPSLSVILQSPRPPSRLELVSERYKSIEGYTPPWSPRWQTLNCNPKTAATPRPCALLPNIDYFVSTLA